ncbi:hypothetical protein NQ117_05135 [Paenibacillus sp. SC116]|nr:hypothetical protein [Paenibacillus sp. SC116]
MIAGFVYISHEAIANGVFTGLLTDLAACKLYDVGVKPLVRRKGKSRITMVSRLLTDSSFSGKSQFIFIDELIFNPSEKHSDY